MDAIATRDFAIVPVWRQVGPDLRDELVAFWQRNAAIPDPAKAAARAAQAVCIGRDEDGAICAVGTAVVSVLPRMRQPMYFYRQFFAPGLRGQRRGIPFLNEARRVLEAYNATLPVPEALGVLLELENQQVAANHTRAYEPHADSTFIGYSPRGFQLRVSYFADARLQPPRPVRKVPVR